MNLFSDIRALVIDALAEMSAEGVLPAGLDTAAVAVEPPRDLAHGDMATNAAMVLAKPAGMSPRTLADALATKLVADARITEPTRARKLLSRAHPALLPIARLPADMSEAVSLVLGLGLTYDEAAEACNCAPGTIKSRVSRARALLVEQIEGASRAA